MSAASNWRDINTGSAAVGNQIHIIPRSSFAGTSPVTCNFKPITWITESPIAFKEDPPKVKSRWLRKQVKQHGWRKK